MIDVALPTGRWAVGVSGGADSVALLLLLHGRPDLSLHVVHLDHETRGGDSAADAAFVVELAGRLGLPVTVAKRSDVERDPPRNPSARYRAARLALFRRVVAEQGLDGVMLAHHAADQAETVMLRILRGGGARTLVGMRDRSQLIPFGDRLTTGFDLLTPGLRPSEEPEFSVGDPGLRSPIDPASTAVKPPGLVVVRPLLQVWPDALRRLLRDRGQPWREDASNTSGEYLRNRVRPWLAGGPALADALLALAAAARRVRGWLDGRAPVLAEAFAASDLALPRPIARHAAGRWLAARGVPADSISLAVCDRLIAMATDAATPPRQTFPGGVSVGRARGRVAIRPPPRGR